MPNQVEQKTIDPEAELSNVQRMFKRLAPLCSVAKRAAGIPQLAPQEKQLDILTNEIKETLLCINLAKKGQHAIKDSYIKRGTEKSLLEYEQLESVLRDEKAQQSELDCLNYLAQKRIVELLKNIPTEADELAMIESAQNRLRQMENRLELATKRFCLVNTDNKRVRSEIHRLLVERNSFNVQWNRTIGKLVKGKEYLMDIFEIATAAFADRDEMIRKLEALKWKGLFQLNRDISEMQSFEGEINHLAKLEEFLRVKGSRRICEADEKEEMKRLEDQHKCETEIVYHDNLLEAIFNYSGTEGIHTIINRFKIGEIENYSMFLLLCNVLEETIMITNDLTLFVKTLTAQKAFNEAREEKQRKRIESLNQQLETCREQTEKLREMNAQVDETIVRTLKGIEDLVTVTKTDTSPLLSLLGNHKEVTKWNVMKFLRILEREVKAIIEVVYGAVKPPAPTPSKKGAKGPSAPEAKMVADPTFTQVKPNRIDQLVPYQPCAFCVEDYIMNLVFETPAVPADKEYVEEIFHMDEVNTKFGIHTLTIAARRHPFRGAKKD